MAEAIGKHWLLLRGLGRESAHWGDFVPLLRAAFPEAQISLLDLPGTGDYHRQTSPASIPLIAERVRESALEQGLLAQPVTLLAISLGGMVAWQWLQAFPQDLCGAVLMNTSFANLSPFYQRLRWRNYGRCLTMLMQADRLNRERMIVELVCNRHDRHPELAEQWAAIHAARPISLLNGLCQIIAAAGYRPGKTQPRRPVLLLNSLGDRLVAPQCSEKIKDQWRLPLYSHPWAGHDLAVDDGEWVIRQMKDWLDREQRG